MRTQLCVCGIFMSALAASGQTLVIPQIADGNGWQTELVLTNTGTTATTVSLNFFQSVGAGVTQNWTPPFLETSVLQNIPLPAASTVFLHTPGTAGSLSEGWAQVEGNSAVSAYAIFEETVSGRQNQDGTAPAAPTTSRMLVPFDNTNGFVTTMAIVNTTGSSESIAVDAQATGGAAVQLSAITLPPNGYMAFTLPQQFPSISSAKGLLELYASTGSFSLIALRFNPTGAFTAAPVFPETGSPVIMATDAGVAVFNGMYAGTYSGPGISGPVMVTVNNGTLTLTEPAGGTGTIMANGQVTFGTAAAGGATCSFSGMITVTGTTASGTGTFSCTNVAGTWNVTRQ
jgi:hypothetical protein